MKCNKENKIDYIRHMQWSRKWRRNNTGT